MAASTDCLRRTIGLPGAVLMGLGSILGTGIFVSVGIAAGVGGPSVVVAVVLAAFVAAFNGLSSAQLAAAYPVSGGTYAYGYRYLSAPLGFTAGWMFLLAKSASAATAALGFAGYALSALGVSGAAYHTGLAVAAVAAFTLLVAGGMQRSKRVNTVIVSVTLLALGCFIALGAPTVYARGAALLEALAAHPSHDGGLWTATALMFVAYTGYGRIATLGEEVAAPARTIPRAIVATLVLTLLLYTGVAVTAVTALGAEGLAAETRATGAPLQHAALVLAGRPLAALVAAGALAAMAGVLLNLLLGLSRVALAMARTGDLPAGLARIDAQGSPRNAVLAVGVLIGGLAALGSIKLAWSFSAFTVLVYYAITNLAALRLPRGSRRYPRAVPLLGLAGCLSLAFWVEPAVWAAGLALIGLGLTYQWVVGRARKH